MGETRLLELKARQRGLAQAAGWCVQHATAIEDVRQVDTYFHVGQGRLKLRVVEERPTATLIYYQREDRPEPKRSRVSLLLVADPTALLALLREALGVFVEVRKRRRVFRWGEVQIHLDEVGGLGDFIEFERRIDGSGGEAQAKAEFAELRASLDIRDEDLVARSYSDAILERESDARRA